jgi:hypothetical protein
VEDARVILREYLQNAPATSVDREEAREILSVIGGERLP